MEQRRVEFQNMVITDFRQLVANCNEITFINKGSTTATITALGPLDLAPNESFTYVGYPGDLNQTNYSISFAASSSDNKIVAILKRYL